MESPRFVSPIELYLGLHGPESAVSRYRSQQQEVQQRIAECMKGHGFAYIPYIPEIDFHSSWEDRAAEGPESAAQRGYGFVQANGHFDERATVEAQNEDPNQLLISALDDQSLRRYWSVTSGPSGCEITARKLGFSPRERAAMDELGIAYEALRLRIATDARYLEAMSVWSDCMRGHGYRFPDRSALLAGIPTLLGGRLDAGESYEEVLGAEIELAVADVSCFEPVANVVAGVVTEHEQQFIIVNQELLDIEKRVYGY